ncbi:holo-ACP synthase [Streptomyces sp. NPDC058486]|uniref:holo-ACP synthase n=1 Tax=unclassified Streptomyces TaxID=2593676 RepID=UPI00365D179B
MRRLFGARTACAAPHAVGFGVDLLSLERFRRVSARERGRRMVFHPAELAYAQTLGESRRDEFLAGRFCAKEATAKALGRGLGQGLGWRDIEVTRDALGAPGVRLHGRAADLARVLLVGRVTLSLSHQEGFVVCVAVAYAAPQGHLSPEVHS